MYNMLSSYFSIQTQLIVILKPNFEQIAEDLGNCILFLPCLIWCFYYPLYYFFQNFEHNTDIIILALLPSKSKFNA